MRILLKRLSVPAALVVAVCVVASSPGVAQIPIPLLSPTPTPTPKPSPGPTKSSTPKPKPSGGDEGGGSGGSTTKPSPRTSTKRRTSLTPPVTKGVAAWLARTKSPAHTTTRLLQLLSEMRADGRPLSVADMRGGFGRFPVLGYVWYQDDWGAPRYIPYYHPHNGNDLFAAQGTPVIATVDGTIMRTVNGVVAGNAIWLRQKGSRAYFFYGHLFSFAPGIRTGKHVRRGDVIGYVGATGDAVGTPPHVHFEMHPTGSPDRPVNPKPHLDSWLVAAERRALGILGYSPDGTTRAGIAPWTNFLTSIDSVDAAPAFWTAALDGSTLFATVDLTLDRFLATQDFTASPSDGADFTAPRYDPTQPLAALFARAGSNVD